MAAGDLLSACRPPPNTVKTRLCFSIDCLSRRWISGNGAQQKNRCVDNCLHGCDLLPQSRGGLRVLVCRPRPNHCGSGGGGRGAREAAPRPPAAGGVQSLARTPAGAPRRRAASQAGPLHHYPIQAPRPAPGSEEALLRTLQWSHQTGLRRPKQGRRRGGRAFLCHSFQIGDDLSKNLRGNHHRSLSIRAGAMTARNSASN